jgi:hypothetical protein
LAKVWALAKAASGVVVFVGGAAWAFFQFVWTEHLGPRRQPASLSVTTTTRLAGCQDNQAIVEVSVVIKNTSKAEASIIVGDHQAIGSVVERSNEDEQSDEHILANLTEQYRSEYPRTVSRFTRVGTDEYFYYRPLPLPLPTTLGPGEETLSEFLLYIPTGRYDVVRVATHLHAVRNRDGLSADLAAKAGQDTSSSRRPDSRSIEPRFFAGGRQLKHASDPELTSRRYHRTISYKTFALWNDTGPVCGGPATPAVGPQATETSPVDDEKDVLAAREAE